MATIRAYTTIEQSKKLAEILPLESADMYYWCGEDLRIGGYRAMDIDYDIPAWSLVALLNVLPKEIEIDGQHYAPCLFPVKSKWLLKLWYNSNYILTSPIAIFSDNPIDACFEMIIKLDKLKLL